MKMLELWTAVFKRVWIWSLFSVLVQSLMTLFIQQVEFKESVLFFTWGFLFFCLSIVISIIGIILINQAAWDKEHKTRTPLLSSIEKNFKYMIIETLRSLFPVILKTFLLVIPGIIEIVRLWWVVYVVQFNPAYQKGQIDALHQSRTFVKGRFLKASGLLIFVFILSMLPRLLGNEGELISSPLKLGLALFSSVSLEIYGGLLLYRFYIKNS